MRAELLKLKYLPFPRWTAAFLVAVVAVMGVALAVTEPGDPGKYVSIPNSSVGLITALTALVFGVWVSTLEFAAGTLQRTLIAEPDRRRVLTSKLVLVIVATAIAGLLVAAAAGGLAHLAANRAGVEIDDGDLAGDLFGAIPTWVSGAVIGYGFGLLGRSLGGGIAASFVFVLAFDGLISFIPGAQDYTWGQLSSDLSAHLGATGETQSGLAASIVGTILWSAAITIPGWIRFTRGDLK
jgi:ABC-2 type transport system permease protein